MKQGSGRTVSDFAVVHSQEGRFVKTLITVNGKKQHQLNLAAGGHGQAGIDLLDKYGIEYNIVKTYPNGVRVGNIPGHKKRAKTFGIGQSWFPRDWTDKDIKRAGSHVAGLKGNRRKPDGVIVYGVYKGVRVGVIKTHGKIATVFPDSDQSSVIDSKEKEKMSIKDEYPEIIKQRIKDDGLDDTPDYWETSPTIKCEIELFTRNLQETIDFLDNDCTAEQLSWMAEVFEEISAKLQSWDFVDALKRTADRFPQESQKYSIFQKIEYAIGQLDDDVYQQRFPLKND